MLKYLYLTDKDWVIPWLNGGEIPISLASKYKKGDRSGIYTPDENLIHDSPVNLNELITYGIEYGLGGKKNTFINCKTGDGRKIPNLYDVSLFLDDGLILSFSNNFRLEIAKRLGKKACVEILDIKNLKNTIDNQLEVIGVMKECEYTKDHQRNHFLKSIEDKWQDEFRLFWNIQTEQRINMSKGIAIEIKL
jgi:hypothetical protein